MTATEQQAARALTQFDEWANTFCVFRDRDWGGISSLYRHFAEFCDGRNPCDAEVFTWILRDQGFSVCDGLVYGLILAADLPSRANPEKRATEDKQDHGSMVAAVRSRRQ